MQLSLCPQNIEPYHFINVCLIKVLFNVLIEKLQFKVSRGNSVIFTELPRIPELLRYREKCYINRILPDKCHKKGQIREKCYRKRLFSEKLYIEELF